MVRRPLVPWSLVGKIVPFWAQSLLLESHGDEPSYWKFVSTSFDIVVQGRQTFKFNQAWISARLLLTGLLPPREA